MEKMECQESGTAIVSKEQVFQVSETPFFCLVKCAC